MLAFDRRQRGTFNKTFEDYVATRVSASRIRRGTQMLQRHASMLSRIERQFGVPAQLIVAIWGLETDFGGDTGKLPTIRVLATMAHDCRRTELFQKELLAALKVLQRGDLTLAQMRGAYAGELGQTQFLPSSYYRFAIDYDGNGHADLIKSVPDVLASTANYLKGYGWKAGQPFHEGTENFEILREWNRAWSTARPSSISPTSWRRRTFDSAICTLHFDIFRRRRCRRQSIRWKRRRSANTRPGSRSTASR